MIGAQLSPIFLIGFCKIQPDSLAVVHEGAQFGKRRHGLREESVRPHKDTADTLTPKGIEHGLACAHQPGLLMGLISTEQESRVAIV